MNPKVTVLMPCGGKGFNSAWLVEAVQSVLDQTVQADEILFVDDGVDLNLESLFNIRWVDYTLQQQSGWVFNNYLITAKVWKTPWHLGFSTAFNCGVGLAEYELIIYVASDDRLFPTAIEEMQNAYWEHDQMDAFYSCSYEINGETHTIPNNLGMLTRNLWRWFGGYPPAAFVGPDAAMHSVLMKHAPERRIWVKDGTPLYWVRDHDNTETKVHTWKYVDEMNSIRGKLTDNFVPQEGIILK